MDSVTSTGPKGGRSHSPRVSVDKFGEVYFIVIVSRIDITLINEAIINVLEQCYNDHNVYQSYFPQCKALRMIYYKLAASKYLNNKL